MKQQTQHLHTAIAAAVLATAGMASFSATAATATRLTADERAQVQQTYRAERAACLDGSSTQERSACLAEATAARQEALRGELGLQTVALNERLAPAGEDLMANALSRCDAVPTDVRGDCERRVLGDDVIVTGSVAEGVIVRELPVREAVVVAMADTGLPVIQAEPVELLMEAPPEAELLSEVTAAAGDARPDADPVTAEASLAMGESLAEPQAEPQTPPERDIATSSLEPSPYPTWLQPQRFE